MLLIWENIDIVKGDVTWNLTTKKKEKNIYILKFIEIYLFFYKETFFPQLSSFSPTIIAIVDCCVQEKSQNIIFQKKKNENKKKKDWKNI